MIFLKTDWKWMLPSHFGPSWNPTTRACMLNTLLEIGRDEDRVLTFLVEMIDLFLVDTEANLPETVPYIYKMCLLGAEESKMITP